MKRILLVGLLVVGGASAAWQLSPDFRNAVGDMLASSQLELPGVSGTLGGMSNGLFKKVGSN